MIVDLFILIMVALLFLQDTDYLYDYFEKRKRKNKRGKRR